MIRRIQATIALAKFLSTSSRVRTGRAGCRAADRVWSEKRPSIFLDIVVFQFLANDTQKSELLFRSGRFSFSFSNWRILSKRVSLQLTRLGHHFVSFLEIETLKLHSCRGKLGIARSHRHFLADPALLFRRCPSRRGHRRYRNAMEWDRFRWSDTSSSDSTCQCDPVHHQ